MAEPSTLARPYAKAAFDYARSHSELGGWSQQLALLAALASTEKVAAAIDRPSSTAEEQAELLVNLAGEELTAPVKNFISIAAEHKRLALLEEIHRQFELYKAQQEKSVDVDLVTAFPIEDSLLQQLSGALKNKLQREVTLKTAVDQSLLGGVVIRAGDTVIDDSVRGRLAKLAKAMNS